MMSGKNALKIRFLHTLWVALIIILIVWLMSVLKCDLATPVY
ncbi:MAG: hypothetical protein ACYS3S_25870 [Planctomycetota bacterium]